MSFKQIVIQANNRSIDIRAELLSYGLENDFKEKIFINKFELEPLVFEQLVWLCDKHFLEYNINEHQDEKEDNSDYLKYTLLEIDNFNYLIKLNENKFTCYFINFYFSENWVEIHILDTRKGLYLKDKIPHFKTKDKLFEVLEYYSYHHKRVEELNFEESDFFIVANPLLKTNKILYNEKENIRRFKFDTIRKIQDNGTSFLCNCVPGFYPETEFKLLGNKIQSSTTQNYLTENQEYKVWKYLFNHRHFIAKRKESTLYDLYINRKIFVNINSFEIKALIVKITYEDYNNKKTSRLIVSVSDGNNIYKLPKPISQDDLTKMIIDAR